MSLPKFEMRMEPDLREQLHEAAAKRGMSDSAWVKEQIRIGLHQQPPFKPGQAFAKALQDDDDCPHEHVKVLTYGTFCGDCGTRLVSRRSGQPVPSPRA